MPDTDVTLLPYPEGTAPPEHDPITFEPYITNGVAQERTPFLGELASGETLTDRKSGIFKTGIKNSEGYILTKPKPGVAIVTDLVEAELPEFGRDDFYNVVLDHIGSTGNVSRSISKVIKLFQDGEAYAEVFVRASGINQIKINNANHNIGMLYGLIRYADGSMYAGGFIITFKLTESVHFGPSAEGESFFVDCPALVSLYLFGDNQGWTNGLTIQTYELLRSSISAVTRPGSTSEIVNSRIEVAQAVAPVSGETTYTIRACPCLPSTAASFIPFDVPADSSYFYLNSTGMTFVGNIAKEDCESYIEV